MCSDPTSSPRWQPRSACGDLFTCLPEQLAIPVGRLLPERLRNHTNAGTSAQIAAIRVFWPPQTELLLSMRRIVLSSLKILVSAALLYLTLRKVDFHELAS